MTFQREERYTVLKITDVGQALDADEREALIHYEQKVAAWRENNGKRPLVAVVVESDWPEYEPTWAAIEQRMTGRALPSAELERDEARNCIAEAYAVADVANDARYAAWAERDSYKAAAERMQDALRVMARQKLSAEVSEEDRENADYEAGYEALVRQARAAIAQRGGKGE